MLVSELKPKEEILGELRPGERVFLLACGGCAKSVQSAGEKAVRELSTMLSAAGHPVVGALDVPFLCNKALVGMRLARVWETVEKADALLVASCGVGVQAVATVVGKPVLPACNTLTYGAFQGIWPSEERCARC
ncbi:MAG: 5,10-methylene tetrahydromethanopterin reductase, partial [Candidatus Bipolaricaulaceae bacterium]